MKTSFRLLVNSVLANVRHRDVLYILLKKVDDMSIIMAGVRAKYQIKINIYLVEVFKAVSWTGQFFDMMFPGTRSSKCLSSTQEESLTPALLPKC